MVITDFLERNARLYGDETALVEINPSEERDRAKTWQEFQLIENTRPDLPYRREMTWKQFDERANRFANLLLSRGVKKGQKVGILLMNCLEWLPIYFGILKTGALAVPMNFRYSSDEIELRRPRGCGSAGLRAGIYRAHQAHRRQYAPCEDDVLRRQERAGLCRVLS